MDTDFDSHLNKQTIKLRSQLGMGEAKRVKVEGITPARTNADRLPDVAELQNNATGAQEIDLELLVESIYQPRKEYNPDALLEIASSIKINGLLQPISVAPTEDGRYMIIYGHRRAKGCEKAGLKTVKAFVVPMPSKQKLAVDALIENIQREDMNPIDLALSYKRLLDEGMFPSIEAIAKEVGKSRTDVSRTLAVLTLPDSIATDIAVNKTIKDRLVIDALRKIEDHTVCQEFYDWYIKDKPSRDEFIQKVKNLHTDEPKESFNIKNTTKGCTIKLPKISEEQAKKIEEFIRMTILIKGK